MSERNFIEGRIYPKAEFRSEVWSDNREVTCVILDTSANFFALNRLNPHERVEIFNVIS